MVASVKTRTLKMQRLGSYLAHCTPYTLDMRVYAVQAACPHLLAREGGKPSAVGPGNPVKPYMSCHYMLRKKYEAAYGRGFGARQVLAL